jgi:predicted dehydrogenase
MAARYFLVAVLGNIGRQFDENRSSRKPQKSQNMKVKPLQGAIIGAGFFAGFQAEAWQRIAGCEMVAVADPLTERVHEFAGRWGIPRAYGSAEELLRRERLAFVDIATRPETHLPLVELAAAHGVQVICQKPLAPTWEECVRMIEVCRAAQVRLLIHENWRWQAWYREIKKLIEAGTFGRVYHLGFCMRNGDGRGPQPYAVQPYFSAMPRLLVYETLVHFIDTFRFLAGDIEAVFCQIHRINPRIAGEDYAVMQLNFTSGIHGLIDANRIAGAVPSEVAFGVFTLEGERAALRMTPRGELFITEYGQPEVKHAYEIPSQGYKSDSVFAAQRHYATCLRDGAPCETEGETYLQTVRAVFACYESAETGRFVTLK